jgi:hypothetical protein
MKKIIVDGKEVPVLPAKAKEIIKHKRTGHIYASKEEFNQDVDNPNTDTTNADLQQDVEITVASLQVFGKTKND